MLLLQHTGEEKGTAATNPGLGYAGMFDFFGELKRILVSLTEVASLVQHVNSEDGQDSDMETDESEVHVSYVLLSCQDEKMNSGGKLRYTLTNLNILYSLKLGNLEIYIRVQNFGRHPFKKKPAQSAKFSSRKKMCTLDFHDVCVFLFVFLYAIV